MSGIYNIGPIPGGSLRIEDARRGLVGIYSTDGTYRGGHRFGWFTVSVLRTQFQVHQQTKVVIS